MSSSLLQTDVLRSKESLYDLLNAGTSPHVSLFVPTHRAWNQRKKNRLMLSGLLDDAKAALNQRGLSEEESTDLLKPASDLVDHEGFWRNPTNGLAFFVSQDFVTGYHLPFSPPETQFVDRRFHLRPLWPELQTDGPFFLLALSQGGVKLFEGSRYRFEEVPLENVPTTLEEALQYDEHERSVSYHTGTQPGVKGDSSKRSAVYHGHEDAGDKAYVKEGILRFFQELDREVCRLLGQETSLPPLVLAGTETLRGLYRKATSYQYLTENDVEGHHGGNSAGEFDVDALHERGWEMVAPIYQKERADAEARFGQLSASGKAEKSFHAVVSAAYQSRIDTLFVAQDATAWGQYDTAVGDVEVRDEVSSDETELLNAAMSWTLAGNGTVYVVDPSDVPSQNPLAAILRY